MTSSTDNPTLIQRVADKHINDIPKFHQEYVLSQISLVCEGKAGYHGALAEIHRRYGQRVRDIAKKILDGILLECAVPSETG